MHLHCTILLYSYTQTYNENISRSTYVQKLAMLPFLNVKSPVYLIKSCTTTFCRRGYGLGENDFRICFCTITIPAYHAGDLKRVKKDLFYKSNIAIWPNKVMAFLKQNTWYLPWIKSQTFLLNANLETAIKHDYRNEWPIVVTCNSR